MNTNEIIKMLRQQKKLSQADLAQLAGYTDRSSIAKIESGAVDLTESKIVAFAKIFDVSPSYLMGLSTSPVSSPAFISSSSAIVLTEDEQELVAKYQQLTDLNKGRVLQQIDTLLDGQKQDTVKSINSVG